MSQESRIAKASDGKSYPFWDSARAPSSSAGVNQEWLQMRRLNKGDSCTLPASTKALQMGLKWDKGKDVDCSVALFDAGMQNVDRVWYQQLVSTCGSIVHSGDNLTGEGDGDDETININLSELPINIQYLLFVVTVYTSSTVFSQVKNLKVEMRHGENPTKGDELFTMSLSNLPDQATLVGQLVRKGPKWLFYALGEATRGRDICQVLKDGTVDEFLSRSPSIPVVVREISVCILEGKDLAAKDFSCCGRNATSDPYYIVNFKGKRAQSEVQKKTLEPVWSRRSISLGGIKEGEREFLEISIFDHDFLKRDDFMGVVRVAAGELHSLGLGEHRFWFELDRSNQERHRNEAVSGEILVEINVKESEVSRRGLQSGSLHVLSGSR